MSDTDLLCPVILLIPKRFMVKVCGTKYFWCWVLQMIKRAAARPGDRVTAIMGHLRDSGLLSDPTAPGFGMSINTQMMQARGPD